MRGTLRNLAVGLLLATAQVHADAIDAALALDPPFDARFPAAVVELAIPSQAERMPAHAYLAAGKGPHPTVLLLHGFPGNERNLDIAQALRRFGFNTVFFHYRGAWGAEGDYRITQLPDDTLAVLDYLRDPENATRLRVDTAALSLLGHSLGGYTALATGARDTSLRCVMSLSPVNLGLWQAGMKGPLDANAERLAAYADSLFMLEGLSAARMREELNFADSKILDTRSFGPDLIGKSVLMIVGEQDQVTPAATMFDPVVAEYQKLATLDLSAVKLSGDHSFSWSRIALTREILGWADDRCRSDGQ
jgi:pimeloyl-ACP methyl ester carboxylesterase